MTRSAPLALALAVPAILVGWLVSRGGLDEWAGARMRALVAFAALAMAVHLRTRRRAGRPLPAPLARGVTLAVGLVAVAAWWDFGRFPATGGVHRHDVYHYYLGGKYPRELGYDLLYRCTAVAEAESGREAQVRARKMRDLDTLQIVPAADALADPEACRGRFSPERWRTFREDVEHLREGVSETAWAETQTDHGYNPTPAWTALGGTLARLVPSTLGGLRFLASLDLVLMAAGFAALYAAFGARVTALALVLWGTQEPGKFIWMAFAMLRLDWLFLLIVALALLRRRHATLAGAAVGVSAALRGFPLIGLAGVLLAGVAHPSLRARFAADRRRFALGFGAALTLAVALGAVAAGPSSWTAWAGHIRRHAAGASSNNVGLGVVVSFDPRHRVEQVQERDPTAPSDQWQGVWADENRETLAARKPIVRALQLAFGALLLVALARARRPWIGLALAIVAVPAATDLSGYYLVLFVVAAVLAPVRAWIERGLYAFAGGVQVLMVMPAVAWYLDDRYFALSLAYLGAAAVLAVTVARRRRRHG